MTDENKLALHACGKHIEDHAKTLQLMTEQYAWLMEQTKLIANIVSDNKEENSLDVKIMDKKWVCEFRYKMVKIASELAAADRILKVIEGKA